jgi:hypothetical protein
MDNDVTGRVSVVVCGEPHEGRHCGHDHHTQDHLLDGVDGITVLPVPSRKEGKEGRKEGKEGYQGKTHATHTH